MTKNTSELVGIKREWEPDARLCWNHRVNAPPIISPGRKYTQQDKIPRNEERKNIQIERTGAIDREHGEYRDQKAEFNKRLENDMQNPFHTANIQKQPDIVPKT